MQLQEEVPMHLRYVSAAQNASDSKIRFSMLSLSDRISVGETVTYYHVSQ